MENPKPYAITNEVWMVPCKILPNIKGYKPLIQPFLEKDFKRTQKLRNSWTEEEDAILKKIVEQRGPKNWSSIAKELNLKAYNSYPERKGKQCRERWFNKLNPILTKEKWSETEDILILTKQAEFGNRWKEISILLQGRTENQVKNRWKSLKRKFGKNKEKKVDKEEFGFQIDFFDGNEGSNYFSDRKSICSIEDLELSQISLGNSMLLGNTGIECSLGEKNYSIMDSPISELFFQMENEHTEDFFGSDY